MSQQVRNEGENNRSIVREEDVASSEWKLMLCQER
jgi:hypothetical protein